MHFEEKLWSVSHLLHTTTEFSGLSIHVILRAFQEATHFNQVKPDPGDLTASSLAGIN